MNEIYRVPKRQLPAEVTLVGQSPMRLILFLAGQAAHHAGYERPSDLLKSVGMVTLTDSLFDLAKRGEIEVDEAYACAVNRQGFKALADRGGMKLAA